MEYGSHNWGYQYAFAPSKTGIKYRVLTNKLWGEWKNIITDSEIKNLAPMFTQSNKTAQAKYNVEEIIFTNTVGAKQLSLFFITIDNISKIDANCYAMIRMNVEQHPGKLDYWNFNRNMEVSTTFNTATFFFLIKNLGDEAIQVDTIFSQPTDGAPIRADIMQLHLYFPNL